MARIFYLFIKGTLHRSDWGNIHRLSCLFVITFDFSCFALIFVTQKIMNLVNISLVTMLKNFADIITILRIVFYVIDFSLDFFLL